MSECKTFRESFPMPVNRVYDVSYAIGFIGVLLYGANTSTATPPVKDDDGNQVTYFKYFTDDALNFSDVCQLNEMFYQKYGRRYVNIDDEDIDYWFKGGAISTMTNTQKQWLYHKAYSLLSMYGAKWKTLIEGFGKISERTEDWVYNPLENYNAVESITEKTKNTGDQTNAKTGTETQKFTPGITEQNSTTYGKTTKQETDIIEEMDDPTENTVTTTVNNSGFGFDSTGTAGVPVGKSSQDVSTTMHKETSGNADDNKVIESGTDTTTRSYLNSGHNDTELSFSNRQDKRTDNLTEDFTHSMTRHGNIGVTTSQQMAESEISMRKFLIYDEILKDILSVYSLSIY